MTDKLSIEARSENMRRIRSTNTGPEMTVRRMVYRMGHRYRLHVAGLPGKPDLVFSRLKRIIEVRGCFWHLHGECPDSHVPKSRSEYWQKKLENNRRRDEENERKLAELGWKVLVIWECELKDPHEVAARIHSFLWESEAG